MHKNAFCVQKVCLLPFLVVPLQPIFNKTFLEMNKKLLIGAAALIVSTSTFAGGLLTNTNQNATFLRNPARNAAIGIDGVYNNPAGIAFLPEGFHLSLSWQAAWQKREISSQHNFYALNAATPGVTSKDFVGDIKAPVIPSFHHTSAVTVLKGMPSHISKMQVAILSLPPDKPTIFVLFFNCSIFLRRSFGNVSNIDFSSL